MMVMLSSSNRGRFPKTGSSLITFMTDSVLKTLAARLLAHDLDTQQALYIGVLSTYTAASLTRQSSGKWRTSCQCLAPGLLSCASPAGLLRASLLSQEGTGFLLACSFTRLLYSAF